jgi:hypothetical protein
MSTFISVNTYAYSVTFLTDKMMSSLKLIIILSGLDPSKYVSDWAVIERGVKKWLETKYLERVVLEVFNPRTDNLVGRWDFDINYSYSSDADGTMWVDPDAIKFAIQKAGLNPAGCNYRIVATTKDGRPDVVGWTSTTLRSTDGFVRQSIGTTVGANPLSSTAAYWRKN